MMEQDTAQGSVAVALIETLQMAMLARYDKPIEVTIQSTPDGVKPYFRFKKPGLIPTALEKEYFDGVAEGFRAALGVLLKREPEPGVTANG